MSTCKDCLHYEVCKLKHRKYFAEETNAECLCKQFKPKADYAPVVRCKDCKYWDCYGGEDSHKGDCAELVGLESCMYEDDYCSYGERKESEVKE